jgi:peptide-methionine (S)-S-oxide reductase
MHIVFFARALVFAFAMAGGASLFDASAEAQEKNGGGSSVATFAGGCFWSIEKAFDGKPGVISAVSGFMGGTMKNPTYNQVVSGTTGHLESVQVTYDPAKITYDKLLDIFWHDIDPTDPNGQFCDYGEQYHTAVFVHDPAQRTLAEASKAEVAAELKKDVSTEIRDASEFTAAGPEHQDFAHNNAAHYNAYLIGCRRDAKLKSVWGEKAHAKI